jgi:hypothetical protein
VYKRLKLAILTTLRFASIRFGLPAKKYQASKTPSIQLAGFCFGYGGDRELVSFGVSCGIVKMYLLIGRSGICGGDFC